MELNVHEIPNNSFQFFLWSIKEKEIASIHNSGNPDDTHIYIDHKLIGECYISLYKIYTDEEV